MYNEADTRAKLIDPRLHAAGWDEERIKREHYFTKGQIYLVGDKARRKQPLKADYLLRYNAALPLAVVEAKQEVVHPVHGLQRALWCRPRGTRRGTASSSPIAPTVTLS